MPQIEREKRAFPGSHKVLFSSAAPFVLFIKKSPNGSSPTFFSPLAGQIPFGTWCAFGGGGGIG